MTSLVTYSRELNGGAINWVESETCYYSTADQCTPIWDQLHVGSISSSKINIWLGLSRFSEGDTESSKQCVGLSKKKFDSIQLNRMSIGIKGEPTVRDWYAKKIKYDISEVGIAVWKEDPRMRSSLDGIYTDSNGDKHGIEIKIPKKVYWPLMQHFKESMSGKVLDKKDMSHIYGSHYDQMVMSMKVTGVKSMDYVVCGHESNEIFIQKIMPDEKRWNFLYDKAKLFFINKINPLMVKEGIKRIDPYHME
jgi:hypothetical protein